MDTVQKTIDHLIQEIDLFQTEEKVQGHQII